jgi:Protein of unknown function (DUF3108)
MESHFMSFRRAFGLFALCAGLPSVALAQSGASEGRQVEIGYTLTYLGFTGFRIDFKARFDGGRYDAESHTFKEGLIKAVTVSYDGKNRAWGGFLPQGAQPGGGSLSIMVGRTPRTWLAQYGAGGTLTETHAPPWQPRPDQVIPDKDRNGSFDPLTAALSVGMKGDAACDSVVPSNDGKRRIDIILKQVGTESPTVAGVPNAKGDLLVCELYTKRVSGEFDDAPQEAENKREEPTKLWFARMDDTPFRYPVKLEAKQSIGTIHGTMLSFTERPLSPEEKTGMQR